MGTESLEIGLLSPREREVLALMCEGSTAKEAAADLGVSYRTIEVHAQRIKKKLGARSMLHAVVMTLKGQTK